MAIVLDTGILLRLFDRSDPNFPAIRDSLRKLRAAESLLFATQNISEFWNVSTRPTSARGGYGISPELCTRRLMFLETIAQLLPDDRRTYGQWKTFVMQLRISGVQVHDARLAALMNIHGVRKILTLNPRDFVRYPNIEPLTPQQVLSGKV